jgi:hypothetical protein
MNTRYIAYKPKGFTSSIVGDKHHIMKTLNISDGEFDVALRNGNIEDLPPIETISSTPPF